MTSSERDRLKKQGWERHESVVGCATFVHLKPLPWSGYSAITALAHEDLSGGMLFTTQTFEIYAAIKTTEGRWLHLRLEGILSGLVLTFLVAYSMAYCLALSNIIPAIKTRIVKCSPNGPAGAALRQLAWC